MPTLTESLLAAFIVLSAYVVRGIAGFGSGLIAIPLLAFIFPVTLVVPLVVALDFLGSLAQAVKNRQSVSWADVWPLLPFTIAGILAALFLFDALEPEVLTKALGIFVLVMAVYQLLPLPRLRVTRLAAVPTGLFGGLVGTLFGTGGPFYILYLTLRDLNKDTVRASFAMWFVIDGGIRLAGYTTVGLLDERTLYAVGAGVLFAAIGLFIGGRINSDLSPEQFKRLISFLLLASGIGLILK